jgi:hypothetical protein
MQFPASTLEGDYMSIKHGINIQRHNFPTEWMALDLQLGGPMYYPGKAPGGHYQPNPGVPRGPSSGKWPPMPYNWCPAEFVNDQHPNIQAMIETLLTKFRDGARSATFSQQAESA